MSNEDILTWLTQLGTGGHKLFKIFMTIDNSQYMLGGWIAENFVARRPTADMTAYFSLTDKALNQLKTTIQSLDKSA